MASYNYVMAASLSLSDLADATGIEARTIRSYIERGLLPSSETRGRGATYSAEHLARLKVIQALRRARPNIRLNDIRILLQQLKPDQIQSLAGGSIGASVIGIDELAQADDDDQAETILENECTVNWGEAAKSLTGAERLVRLLQEISGFKAPAATSKMEGWQRINVTPDIELSVRAVFETDQLTAFRELADLLRHLLQHTGALTTKGDE
jgi:DNA-binding transcriptional MerR regulator